MNNPNEEKNSFRSKIFSGRMASLISEPLRPSYHRDPQVSETRSILYVLLLVIIMVSFIFVVSYRLTNPTITVTTQPSLSRQDFLSRKISNPELACQCLNKQIRAQDILQLYPPALQFITSFTLNISQFCFSLPVKVATQDDFLSIQQEMLSILPDIKLEPTVWLAVVKFYRTMKRDACVAFSLSDQAIVASIQPQSIFVLGPTEFLAGSGMQFSQWYSNFLSSYFRTARSILEFSIQTTTLISDPLLFNQSIQQQYNASLANPVVQILENDILNSPIALVYTTKAITNFTDRLYLSTYQTIQDLSSAIYPSYFDLCQPRQCSYFTASPWYSIVLDSMGGLGAVYTILLVFAKVCYELKEGSLWKREVDDTNKLSEKSGNSNNSLEMEKVLTHKNYVSNPSFPSNISGPTSNGIFLKKNEEYKDSNSSEFASNVQRIGSDLNV